jgi:hypothetical protein
MAEDNRNYEIEVDIYNMEFGRNGFTHDNIEFIPYADYKERYEKIKDEKIFCPTGKAKISLLAENCNEAIDKAKISLSDYGRLLTFAQDHDVFFHHFKCYEVNNGNRDKKSGLRSAVVGVEKPYAMSKIHPEGIGEFIKTAIPLIRDKGYVEETGIDRAISWFIVANQRHLKIVPTAYPIFWIVLEMLANVHAKAAEKEFITSDDAFTIIKNKGISFSTNITTKKNKDEWEIIDEEKKTTYIVRKENETLNIYLKLNKKIRKKLKANLGCIKRMPIEHKIGTLLKQYGLEQYNLEITEFKKFRDDIIHSNDLSSYAFKEQIENEKKLKRLLEKLMLLMLHFYDNRFVLSSKRLDDLLAIDTRISLNLK